MVRGMKSFLPVFFSTLILTGCVNSTSITRLTDTYPLRPDETSLMWTVGSDAPMSNVVWVEEVDNVKIRNHGAPVEVSPGLHTVIIRHRRQVFCLASIVGPACLHSSEYKTLSLRVEGDHSYMPFAAYSCEKSWIWIQDTGQRPTHDLKIWRNSGTMAPEFDLADDVRSRNQAMRQIIAGEFPPEQCQKVERSK